MSCEEIIQAIALSNNNIIDYHSQEFVAEGTLNRENIFLYSYLDAVISIMLENKKYNSAELLIRLATQHTKKALSQLRALIAEVYDICKETGSYPDDYIRKVILYSNFSSRYCMQPSGVKINLDDYDKSLNL